MMQSLTIVLEAMPYILGGSLVTISIVLTALTLGLCAGVPMAVGQVYGGWVTRTLIGLYVWFFRGVPILVLLFLFYFAPAQLFEFDTEFWRALPPEFSAFSVSCLVLGLTSAAYQSQIFRSGIQTLAQGQLKAARALGMNDGTAIRCVILPQALRLSIPAWSNEFSILLKDSALCFVLGTSEIMARTHFEASRTSEVLPLYISAGILYFIITLIGLHFLRRLEKLVHIPGYAGAMS